MDPELLILGAILLGVVLFFAILIRYGSDYDNLMLESITFINGDEVELVMFRRFRKFLGGHRKELVTFRGSGRNWFYRNGRRVKTMYSIIEDQLEQQWKKAIWKREESDAK